MRCTPVGEWNTKRTAYSGGRRDATKTLQVEAVAQPEEEDDEEIDAVRKPEQKRTYASAYDVSFIFEHLWKKRTTDNEGTRIQPEGCPGIRIPDTVVYKGGFPASWYFHSKVNGQLLKKKTENIYIPKIFEVFGAHNGTCDTQVVACFVGTHDSENGPANSIVYMDRKMLKDFLFAENMMREGFLQRFIAPEGVPYDSSARNSTIHATWSSYNCLVEIRVNRVKLDGKEASTSMKVNSSLPKTERVPVSRVCKLHGKINNHCKAIADHIKATAPDQAELTNMTCYFKTGVKNRLWFLWVSSVSVAPKFQDAFGYIPSLKTFTGRHSPELLCPEFFGGLDKNFNTPAPGRHVACALCNHVGENTGAFAITFKMLADYCMRERERFVDNLRLVTAPDVYGEVKRRSVTVDDIDVRSKAATIFSIIDHSGTHALQKNELWSGLFDLGFSPEEIATVLADRDGPDLEEDPLGSIEESPGHRSPESPARDRVITRPGSEGTEVSDGWGGTRPRGEDKDARTGKNWVRVPQVQAGLAELIREMDPERLARFDRSVDMVGDGLEDEDLGIDGMDDLDASAGRKPGSSGGMGQLEFAKAAARRATARQLTKKLPAMLSNLKQSLSPADLRKIVSIESLSPHDEAAHRKIWVCKECSRMFNQTARDIFTYSDTITTEKHTKKVLRTIEMLSDLKTQAILDHTSSQASVSRSHNESDTVAPPHPQGYPVGEIPSLCTPRIYRALTEHTTRAQVSHPVQITAGASKDLLADAKARREGPKPQQERRKPILPHLTALRINLEAIGSQTLEYADPDMTKLLDRLGLTPRKPVRVLAPPLRRRGNQSAR